MELTERQLVEELQRAGAPPSTIADAVRQYREMMRKERDYVMSTTAKGMVLGQANAAPYQGHPLAGINMAMNAEEAYEAYSLMDPRFRKSALCARMRIGWGDMERKLSGLATTLGESHVFVHFAKGADMVVFKDDAALYPSDQLVTSLRLCL